MTILTVLALTALAFVVGFRAAFWCVARLQEWERS